jgi:hypothetical protein
MMPANSSAFEAESFASFYYGTQPLLTSSVTETDFVPIRFQQSSLLK